MSNRAEVQAVCTTQEARDYFKAKGLTYNNITEGDILVLVMLLNQDIKGAVKCGWGIASLEFSLFDTGKHFTREEAEAALKGEQDG